MYTKSICLKRIKTLVIFSRIHLLHLFLSWSIVILRIVKKSYLSLPIENHHLPLYIGIIVIRCFGNAFKIISIKILTFYRF